MTLALAVIKGSTEYNVSDGTVSWIESLEGIGNAPLHVIEERGPQQHGATDVDYRLDPRSVSIVLGIKAASLSALDTMRQTLESYFAPGNWTTKLKFTLDGGAIRYLDGRADVGPQASFQTGMGYRQNIAVRWRAADPTFYDPVEYSYESAVGSAWTGGLAVPLAVPIGLSLTGDAGEITYEGTWLAYPRMRLYGPITDWKIYNNTTGEKLDGAGDTIASGAWYDFDCRYGYKTVTDSGGLSQIDKLSTDSDLATFHLAPSPEAPGGVNSISVYGSGVGATTQLIVYYYVRYIGI